jgi:hypothetical protein
MSDMSGGAVRKREASEYKIEISNEDSALVAAAYLFVVRPSTNEMQYL